MADERPETTLAAQPATKPEELRRRELVRRLAKAAVIPAVVVAVNSSITPANARP
jgi:hypothetical protein